jgi:hypothetical protein
MRTGTGDSIRCVFISLSFIVSILSGNLYTAMCSQSDSTLEKTGSTSIYICNDKVNPCIGDTPESCAGCPVKVSVKSISLESMMDVLEKWSSAISTAVENSQYETIGRRTPGIGFIMNKIKELEPPKNPSKIKDFQELTKQMKTQAEQLSEAASKSDDKLVKSTFKNMGNTCASCHRQFKK